jgi:hypothetical protein
MRELYADGSSPREWWLRKFAEASLAGKVWLLVCSALMVLLGLFLAALIKITAGFILRMIFAVIAGIWRAIHG